MQNNGRCGEGRNEDGEIGDIDQASHRGDRSGLKLESISFTPDVLTPYPFMRGAEGGGEGQESKIT